MECEVAGSMEFRFGVWCPAGGLTATKTGMGVQALEGIGGSQVELMPWDHVSTFLIHKYLYTNVFMYGFLSIYMYIYICIYCIHMS